MKQIFNPYLPSNEYVPDGEPHVFNNRVYIYGSHDRFNGDSFCLNDYVCYSCDIHDLTTWKYEGVIFKKSDDPNNINCNPLYAPDVVQGVDGRYYLYYCPFLLSYIGVAVSDRPEGPYQYYGRVKRENGEIYGLGKNDLMAFDPACYVENNKVYVYSGFSANSKEFMEAVRVFPCSPIDMNGGHVMTLKEDMITIIEEKMTIPGIANSKGTGFEGHEFYEASSMRKFDDTYYFVYSSVLSHELCYATSKYPDRDFTYGGILISNADFNYHGNTKAQNYYGNIHGGLVKILENYYIFYHRQTNQNEQSRQGCAEKVYIKDGHIEQVECTSQGLNGKPLAGKGEYYAYIACNLRSKDGAIKCENAREDKEIYVHHPFITQPLPDGEICHQYIKNIQDGSVIGFKYFDLDHPMIQVETRGDEGYFDISTTIDGNTIVSIPLKASQDYQLSSLITIPLKGVSALFFTYRGKGKIDFERFILK